MDRTPRIFCIQARYESVALHLLKTVDVAGEHRLQWVALMRSISVSSCIPQVSHSLTHYGIQLSNPPFSKSVCAGAVAHTLIWIRSRRAIRHNPRSVEPTVWPCVVKLSGILCRHPYSDHVRLQRKSKRAAFTTFPGRVGVTCFAAVRPSRCACRFSCVSVKYTCRRVARIRKYCVVG